MIVVSEMGDFVLHVKSTVVNQLAAGSSPQVLPQSTSCGDTQIRLAVTLIVLSLQLEGATL